MRPVAQEFSVLVYDPVVDLAWQGVEQLAQVDRTVGADSEFCSRGVGSRRSGRLLGRASSTRLPISRGR